MSKDTFNRGEYAAFKKVSKILSEEGNEEDPNEEDPNIESVDAEITAWAAGSGKASRPETPDADIEAWAKSNKH